MLHNFITRNTELLGFLLIREKPTIISEFARKNIKVFRIVFSTEGLVLVIIPVLFLIFFGVYSLVYHLSRNRIIKSDIKFLKTLRPRNLFFVVVTIGLIVIIPFSFSRVFTYNNEIDELNREIYQRSSHTFSPEKDDIYDQLDTYAKYVYDNYFYCFAGFENPIGEDTVYIVENSPDELIEHLEDHNINYEFVQYSYSDLAFLSSMVRYESIENGTFSMIEFDFPNNQVVLALKDDAKILDDWQHFLDNGSLVIEIGNWYEIQY